MLNPSQTALVLVDLQQGILGSVKAPHAAADLVTRAAALAAHFRDKGAFVVRVKVGFSPDFGELLKQGSDQPAPMPPGGLPAHWWDDPDGLPMQAGDLALVKRQWNAFHGTELDLQLRRRGITTVVLGGIVTHIGVEGTARAAWELGYQLYIAEDLCSAPIAEPHDASFKFVMPRLGHVRPSTEIRLA